MSECGIHGSKELHFVEQGEIWLSKVDDSDPQTKRYILNLNMPSWIQKETQYVVLLKITSNKEKIKIISQNFGFCCIASEVTGLIQIS